MLENPHFPGSCYLNTFISGIIGLIGVIVGFFLQLLSNYLKEKKEIKKEFLAIKNSIYSTTLVNNLFPELLKLKQFFTCHHKFLKIQENNYFFQKWLSSSYVEMAFSGVGYWNDKKVQEMINDLDKTRI